MTGKTARPTIDALESATDRIVGGDNTSDGVSRLASNSSVVFRATKNPHLLRCVINELTRGHVVALVPELSGNDYCEQISTQIESFASARSTTEGQDEGVLALPTSGSTGSPKLVALPVGKIERFIMWGVQQFLFDNHTTSLSLSPWSRTVLGSLQYWPRCRPDRRRRAPSRTWARKLRPRFDIFCGDSAGQHDLLPRGLRQ